VLLGQAQLLDVAAVGVFQGFQVDLAAVDERQLAFQRGNGSPVLTVQEILAALLQSGLHRQRRRYGSVGSVSLGKRRRRVSGDNSARANQDQKTG